MICSVKSHVAGGWRGLHCLHNAVLIGRVLVDNR